MKEVFIPTIERKQPKARYIKPASVKQLEKDYYIYKYKNSTIPEHCRFTTKLRDDSANGLTNCISKWCMINAHHFQRMNSFGLYDVKLKKWRPSGTTKGISDALLIVDGQTIHLEIKYGKDRQSDVQKDIQKSIERSGGTYLIVKTFDNFLEQIFSLKNGIHYLYVQKNRSI